MDRKRIIQPLPRSKLICEILNIYAGTVEDQQITEQMSKKVHGNNEKV